MFCNYIKAFFITLNCCTQTKKKYFYVPYEINFKTRKLPHLFFLTNLMVTRRKKFHHCVKRISGGGLGRGRRRRGEGGLKAICTFSELNFPPKIASLRWFILTNDNDDVHQMIGVFASKVPAQSFNKAELVDGGNYFQHHAVFPTRIYNLLPGCEKLKKIRLWYLQKKHFFKSVLEIYQNSQIKLL